jgi:hypothetical protein
MGRASDVVERAGLDQLSDSCAPQTVRLRGIGDVLADQRRWAGFAPDNCIPTDHDGPSRRRNRIWAATSWRFPSMAVKSVSSRCS